MGFHHRLQKTCGYNGYRWQLSREINNLTWESSPFSVIRCPNFWRESPNSLMGNPNAKSLSQANLMQVCETTEIIYDRSAVDFKATTSSVSVSITAYLSV